MKKILTEALRKGVVTWILLLLIWYVASLFNSREFLPGPADTLVGARELIVSGVLPFYLGVSVRRIVIGWSLGLLQPVRWLFEPFINFFRFVPAIGFITLFLMWFGVGEASKIVLIMYATIFPVIINTISGVVSIDPIKLQAARSLGASPFPLFYRVVLPASVPHIFTGIRLGFGGAIVSIVAAEMIAAQEGLGFLIYSSRLYYRTDYIFVGIITLGLLGFAADRLLALLGRMSLQRFGVKQGN